MLLRGGTVVEGLELARLRRAGASDRDLARGPARLAVALGVPLAASGADLLAPPFSLEVPAVPLEFAARSAHGRQRRRRGSGIPVAVLDPGRAGVSPYRRHAKSHD